MTSSAELGGKERLQDLLVGRQIDEATGKRDDVCIVMLTAQRSESGRHDICSTNPINLICGDSHADASAAHQHPAFSVTVDNIIGNDLGEIRVVDTIIAIRPAIDNVMTKLLQVRSQQLLLIKTCMVACNADIHVSTPSTDRCLHS